MHRRSAQYALRTLCTCVTCVRKNSCSKETSTNIRIFCFFAIGAALKGKDIAVKNRGYSKTKKKKKKKKKISHPKTGATPRGKNLIGAIIKGKNLLPLGAIIKKNLLPLGANSFL